MTTNEESKFQPKFDLKEVPRLIVKYTNELAEFENRVKIEGKPLGTANREQPAWYAFYDARRVELKSIADHIEDDMKRVRSKLYRKYKEGYNVDLSTTEIDKYINGEEAYLKRKAIWLEVKELEEKYRSAVETIVHVGYALRNITNLVIESMDNVEI